MSVLLKRCPREPYRGKHMGFVILDRPAVRERTFDEPYAVLSIRSPGTREVEIAESPECRGVLRLEFDDLQAPSSVGEVFAGWHARAAVEFVAALHPEVRLLVCQCEAGISRSAGLAAGLSLWLNGECAWMDEHFVPNPRVRELVENVAKRRMRQHGTPQGD